MSMPRGEIILIVVCSSIF